MYGSANDCKDFQKAQAAGEKGSQCSAALCDSVGEGKSFHAIPALSGHASACVDLRTNLRADSGSPLSATCAWPPSASPVSFARVACVLRARGGGFEAEKGGDSFRWFVGLFVSGWFPSKPLGAPGPLNHTEHAGG